MSNERNNKAAATVVDGWGGVLLIEKITCAWWALTTLLILVLWPWLGDPVDMLVTHAKILAFVGASCGAGLLLGERRALRGLLLFVRVGVPLAMLAYWYAETYSFCSLLPYQDHWFALADQWLFGCQPSIAFGEALAGTPVEPVLSEAFNLGYWSFFPMQLIVVGYYFIRHREETDRVASAILASFFLFYLVYFVLPVGGPQFYFEAIGMDVARAGVFPNMGHYLASHREMLTAPGWQDGFFYRLVTGTQATGEFPTAAFPSSHIGCTVVFLCLALRRSRGLFLCLLPLAVLLSCATVYIQAHYLVDAVAGLLSGLAVYQLLTRTTLDVCR